MLLPRVLDTAEIRVLGSLLEKELTTPEYYPLTVKALVAACNQRSNRDPVMDLSVNEVLEALERLRAHALVWRTEGARAERWEHTLSRRLSLGPDAAAVVTVLLLRGPQTTGEIRSRCERMHAFASPELVEAVLHQLSSGDEPLVTELLRRPGQKENRWMHLAGGDVASPPPATRQESPRESLHERLQRLEGRVAELERDLQAVLETLQPLSRESS